MITRALLSRDLAYAIAFWIVSSFLRAGIANHGLGRRISAEQFFKMPVSRYIDST